MTEIKKVTKAEGAKTEFVRVAHYLCSELCGGCQKYCGLWQSQHNAQQTESWQAKLP